VPPSARVLSARKQSQMNGTLQREIDAGILRDACACQRSLRLVRYLHAYQKNGAESELQYFFHPTTNEIGDSRAQFRLCFSDSHKIKVKGYRRWCFRAL